VRQQKNREFLQKSLEMPFLASKSGKKNVKKISDCPEIYGCLSADFSAEWIPAEPF